MSNSTNQLDQIKHIVVLMMENRSLDNMLGYLYDAGNSPPFNEAPNGQTFNGVSGKKLSNPLGREANAPTVPVSQGTVMSNPNPDPGEDYIEVYSQLYNLPAPQNAGGVPPNPPQPPQMLGFLNNYHDVIKDSSVSPEIIMNCFAQSSVPVTTNLAYYYGVCDNWFSSIPTNTMCNRSYMYAGTSSGNVFNEWTDDHFPFIHPFRNDTRTIFNLLENAGVSWKIYYGSYLLFSTALLTQDQLLDYALSRFSQMEQFYKDASTPGGLPAYSFIEPRYMDSVIYGPENDMHPPSYPHIDGPSNVSQGEMLLYNVYNAILNSPDWDSTMLIITFDEHGGTYDHVAPPAATPPDGVVIPPNQPGGSGFEFNRAGVRVPAIVISPYTVQSQICHTVFDHTSILKTVIECFQLKNEHGNPTRLGKREKNAADLTELLTNPTARTDIPPIPKPAGADVTAQAVKGSRPLTEFQKTLVTAAIKRIADLGGAKLDVSETRKKIRTVRDAEEFLAHHERELRDKQP